MPPLSWVAIITRPNLEEVAERGFRQCGYRCYLPQYRKVLSPHGKGRRQAACMRALFPRILLVQRWVGWPSQPISAAVGLVCSRSGVPAGLSDRDVELVRVRELDGRFDEIEHAGTPPGRRLDLHVGDQVAVGDILGVLEGLSDSGRATVAALLLGRAVTINVDDSRALVRV